MTQNCWWNTHWPDWRKSDTKKDLKKDDWGSSDWQSYGSNWKIDDGFDMGESYSEKCRQTTVVVAESTGESKDQMKSLQDMKNLLVKFAEKMEHMEATLLTTKEEACGAKDRIASLEAQVTALQEELREKAAGRSNRPSPPAVAGLPEDAEAEARPCTEWHEHRPDALDVPVEGTQERDYDKWLNHLRYTLFDQDSRVLDQLENKIKRAWPQLEVFGCRTQANRYFFVCCKKCKQFSYGQYGSWAAETDSKKPQEARDDLAKFFKVEVKDCDKRHV